MSETKENPTKVTEYFGITIIEDAKAEENCLNSRIRIEVGDLNVRKNLEEGQIYSYEELLEIIRKGKKEYIEKKWALLHQHIPGTTRYGAYDETSTTLISADFKDTYNPEQRLKEISQFCCDLKYLKYYNGEYLLGYKKNYEIRSLYKAKILELLEEKRKKMGTVLCNPFLIAGK